MPSDAILLILCLQGPSFWWTQGSFSSWVVALTLTSPWLPCFCFVWRLRVLDVQWMQCFHLVGWLSQSLLSWLPFGHTCRDQMTFQCHCCRSWWCGLVTQCLDRSCHTALLMPGSSISDLCRTTVGTLVYATHDGDFCREPKVVLQVGLPSSHGALNEGFQSSVDLVQFQAL